LSVQTNVGSLDSGLLWAYTVALFVVATAAKFLPSMLMGKLCTGRDWRFCVTVSGTRQFMPTAVECHCPGKNVND
jgi:hypothetical protein